MKMRLLTTSAMSLALATAAFAQSPSTAPATSTTTQSQPGSTTTTSPSTSTPAQNSTGTSTSTSQSTTTTPSASSTSTAQTPSTSSSPSQAQTTPSSTSTSTSTSNPAPASTNQAQTPNTSNSGKTAQQPNPQTNTAQSSGTGVNASVNINDQQRTRISASLARVDARPLTNVNFSVSVGTAIPRDVRLAPLPADVVEIVPQYRGYDFVLVKDEIVIVDPATYKIVTVLPHSGHAAAAAPARSKVSFSERDRAVIRKHAKTRVESRTTGSAARTEIRIGEPVPESVEIEELPDAVYQESPGLREYRYIHRENRTYVVEPRERRVIEEID
jgi:DNA mismatch repair ATPase MutL